MLFNVVLFLFQEMCFSPEHRTKPPHKLRLKNHPRIQKVALSNQLYYINYIFIMLYNIYIYIYASTCTNNFKSSLPLSAPGPPQADSESAGEFHSWPDMPQTVLSPEKLMANAAPQKEMLPPPQLGAGGLWKPVHPAKYAAQSTIEKPE